MTQKRLMDLSKNLENITEIKLTYSDFRESVGYNYKEIKPFYVIENIYVNIISKKFNRHFVIKRGFKSDGCTIPRAFRWFLGCNHKGEYLPASIIHDFLLANKEIIGNSRILSSRIFKQALLQEGVNPVIAQIMFLSVEFWQKNIKGWI